MGRLPPRDGGSLRFVPKRLPSCFRNHSAIWDDDVHARLVGVFLIIPANGRPRRGKRDLGQRHIQELRDGRSAQRRVSRGRRGGESGRHRAVRLGQKRAYPLHQRPGGPRFRHHRGRRHEPVRPQGERPRRRPGRGHGVPKLQPLPPQDRAGKRHARTHQGAQGAARTGRARRARVSGPGRPGRQGGQVSRPALRRAAAARRHRARPQHAPEDHAFGRAHERARPGDGAGGARRHQVARGNEHDHRHGDP